MSSWMVKATRSAIVAVGVLGWIVGCSSSDGGGAAAITADDACTQLAAALCDKIQSCAPSYLQLGYGDATTCKARALIECKAGLAAPSTAATPGDTAACATAAKGASCGALLDNDTPAACLPKNGGLDDGKPCADDAQCKSGFCGLDNDKEICGLCAAKPAEGAKCNRGKCPSGLKCARNDTCAKVVAEGGACDDTKPCAAGSSCFKGKCTKDQATEGAACDDKLTNAPGCDSLQGFVCVTNKCMKVVIASEGKECGFDYDTATMAVKGFTICDKGGWCKGIDLTAKPPVFKGTCQAAAKDGEACLADATFNKGPGCLEPAECVGGKCQVPDAATCK